MLRRRRCLRGSSRRHPGRQLALRKDEVQLDTRGPRHRALLLCRDRAHQKHPPRIPWYPPPPASPASPPANPSGIFIIFTWREIAKPTFHHFLPPVYRLVERIGLIIPRKHFTPASEYKKVPRLPDDTLPSVSQIPGLIRSVRRPRSDSVGPQSAADAYETLAYRDKRRRETPNAAQNHDIEKYEREMGTGHVCNQMLAQMSEGEE